MKRLREICAFDTERIFQLYYQIISARKFRNIIFKLLFRCFLLETALSLSLHLSRPPCLPISASTALQSVALAVPLIFNLFSCFHNNLFAFSSGFWIPYKRQIYFTDSPCQTRTSLPELAPTGQTQPTTIPAASTPVSFATKTSKFIA